MFVGFPLCCPFFRNPSRVRAILPSCRASVNLSWGPTSFASTRAGVRRHSEPNHTTHPSPPEPPDAIFLGAFAPFPLNTLGAHKNEFPPHAGRPRRGRDTRMGFARGRRGRLTSPLSKHHYSSFVASDQNLAPLPPGSSSSSEIRIAEDWDLPSYPGGECSRLNGPIVAGSSSSWKKEGAAIFLASLALSFVLLHFFAALRYGGGVDDVPRVVRGDDGL